MHGYIYSAFARHELKEQQGVQNFTQILENLWWRGSSAGPAGNRIQRIHHVYDGIRNGVTTVFDHHATLAAPAAFAIAEVVKAGRAHVTCYEVSDRR